MTISLQEWRARRPMRGFAFEISCPRCGSERSRLVNSARGGGGNTGRDGVGSATELVGIVECCGCQRQYEVIVLLRQHQAFTTRDLATERQRAKRQRERAMA